MKTEKRKLGDFGENIAVKFLMKHNFEIIKRNYLKPWGEIDIIARKLKSLYFFEVKTVSKRNSFVTYETKDSWLAEENIHPAKIARMLKTIQTFLIETNITDDWEAAGIIVEVDEDLKRAKVRFIENILT